MHHKYEAPSPLDNQIKIQRLRLLNNESECQHRLIPRVPLKSIAAAISTKIAND